jgi:hypothetical protein
VIVKDAVGTEPRRLTSSWTPNSAESSVACAADVVSFQSLAGRITTPFASSAEPVTLGGDGDRHNVLRLNVGGLAGVG